MISTFKKIVIGFVNVFSKLFYNYFLLKIISIYLGPVGIGLYSQYRSFWQFSTTLTNLNSSTLIIQRLSSTNNNNFFFLSSVFFCIYF